MKKIFIIALIFLNLIVFNQLFAKDIPIIVIAPSKKPQSVSTVGSSVTVYTEKDIENSSESFLHNIQNISDSIRAWIWTKIYFFIFLFS